MIPPGRLDNATSLLTQFPEAQGRRARDPRRYNFPSSPLPCVLYDRDRDRYRVAAAGSMQIYVCVRRRAYTRGAIFHRLRGECVRYRQRQPRAVLNHRCDCMRLVRPFSTAICAHRLRSAREWRRRGVCNDGR